VSPAQRLRVWGVGVATGHLVLGAVAFWALGVPGSPLFFGLCAALSLVIALVAAPRMTPPRPWGDDPPTGGPGTDDPPPPPWWPDFEREFREHTRRKPPVAA
jgi:hypothetical protein